jgi:hypothetical protein
MKEARMTFKRLMAALAAMLLVSAPARAGSFGLYGSYWNSDQADTSGGGGARIGFDFTRVIELEFHGTYFSNFTTDVNGQSVDVKATPVDGGLRFNLLPTSPVIPFVGAGVTYYFLDATQGTIDNKTGIYAQAGLEVGKRNTHFLIEALWRKMEATLSFASFDQNTQFDGLAGNVGIDWRWGK